MLRRVFMSFALLYACACVSSAQTVSFTLEQCGQMALRHNTDARNAALDVNAARLRKREALAEYFPSINATALAFHAQNPLIRITMTDFLGTSELSCMIQERLRQWLLPYGIKTDFEALEYGYTAGVTLTQPLFAGGRIVTGNALARLGVEAAGVKNDLQRRNTLEQVQKSFHTVAALQYKKESLEHLGAFLDELEKNVSAAVDAGLALPTDLSMVRIRRSELDAGLSKLTLGLRIAKMNLFDMSGINYNPYKGIESDYPYVDDMVVEGNPDSFSAPTEVYVAEEDVVKRLDESKLLEIQVDAKRLERRMTLGGTLPSIAFGASYGYSRALGSPRWNGALYAVLTIPLSDWGRNSLKMERQSIEVEKAENDREYLCSQLVLQLRQLYMELSSAYDRMMIARERESLASTRLRQMNDSFGAGMSTVADVLQSETELHQAQESSADAALEYLSALQAYSLRTRNLQE